jgi:thymidylate kinase
MRRVNSLQMKMHFEFIGLPGAGKSTLRNMLVDALKQRGINALTYEEAVSCSVRRDLLSTSSSSMKASMKFLLYNLSVRRLGTVFEYATCQVSAYNEFVFENSRLMALAAEAVNSRSVTEAERRMLMRMLWREFSAYQLSTRWLEDDEFLILDEGFCHRAITLFGRGDEARVEKNGIDEYLSLVPLPHWLFVVTSQVEVCEARLRKRGYPPILSNLTDGERLEKQNLINGIVEHIALTLSGRNIRIVRLDNSTDDVARMPEDVVEEVIAAVKAIH